MENYEIVSLVKRIEINSLLDIVSYRDLNKACRVNSDSPVILPEFVASLLNETIDEAWDNYTRATFLEQSNCYPEMYRPLARNSTAGIYSAFYRITKRYQQFQHFNTEKSYLLSALVGQDHYLQVKQDLIAFAQIIIKREFAGDWRIKVITTDNAPFKLVNVFITNTLLPQLIYLTSDLILLLKTLDEHTSWGHHDLRDALKAWTSQDDQKMQTYLYYPASLIEVYAAQLHYLTPTNKEKLNELLNNQLEVAIKHDLAYHYHKDATGYSSYNETINGNSRSSIMPFTLDQLYKQYCKQQADLQTDLEMTPSNVELTPSNVAQKPELQTLTNTLLEILADN